MLIEQMNSREYYRSMLLFTAALRELNTKFEIINEEFAIRLKSNPIEHIKSRLKTSHSIAKKLTKKGYEPTLENALKYIDDIAGIRIICSFTEDIYRINKGLYINPEGKRLQKLSYDSRGPRVPFGKKGNDAR